MPLVEVIRKRGTKEDLSSRRHEVERLLKMALASGMNNIMKSPEAALRTTDVHVYWSDMLGCQDAPDLFVKVDFTTGKDLNPRPEEIESLRIQIQRQLEGEAILAGMSIGVYIRPFPGASFGTTKRQVYAV